MKLIKPSFEIIEQEPGVKGIFKQIELAGRTCYKSEDKITPVSAREFVQRMIKSGHGAMLEHGTVYLHMKDYDELDADKYSRDPYSSILCYSPDKCRYTDLYVSTNLRVLVEHYWLDDLKYICEPTKYHEKRYTVKFICDRGVSHEFVRHRVMSFAQESTRYCNYSKDKFGGEITCIQPPWVRDVIGNKSYDGELNIMAQTPLDNYQNGEDTFLNALCSAEDAYFILLDKWDNRVPDKRFKTGFKGNPWTPQQARSVLPNALKTEIVVTGFRHDWEHFFKLRCAENAHPQARELAIPLRDEFIKRKYI